VDRFKKIYDAQKPIEEVVRPPLEDDEELWFDTLKLNDGESRQSRDAYKDIWDADFTKDLSKNGKHEEHDIVFKVSGDIGSSSLHDKVMEQSTLGLKNEQIPTNIAAHLQNFDFGSLEDYSDIKYEEKMYENVGVFMDHPLGFNHNIDASGITCGHSMSISNSTTNHTYAKKKVCNDSFVVESKDKSSEEFIRQSYYILVLPLKMIGIA
jgi:hypothetical protein